MDDLSRFCCLNSGCPEHGQRGAGNLTVTSRYGPEKARRRLRCRVCKARFSERKGTPLFDSRLPPTKVESVLEHIAEGCGVRQTGRLCKVNHCNWLTGCCKDQIQGTAQIAAEIY